MGIPPPRGSCDRHPERDPESVRALLGLPFAAPIKTTSRKLHQAVDNGFYLASNGTVFHLLTHLSCWADSIVMSDHSTFVIVRPLTFDCTQYRAHQPFCSFPDFHAKQIRPSNIFRSADHVLLSVFCDIPHLEDVDILVNVSTDNNGDYYPIVTCSKNNVLT
jgi:hypothetical protein